MFRKTRIRDPVIECLQRDGSVREEDALDQHVRAMPVKLVRIGLGTHTVLECAREAVDRVRDGVLGGQVGFGIVTIELEPESLLLEQPDRVAAASRSSGRFEGRRIRERAVNEEACFALVEPQRLEQVVVDPHSREPGRNVRDEALGRERLSPLVALDEGSTVEGVASHVVSIGSWDRSMARAGRRPCRRQPARAKASDAELARLRRYLETSPRAAGRLLRWRRLRRERLGRAARRTEGVPHEVHLPPTPCGDTGLAPSRKIDATDGVPEGGARWPLWSSQARPPVCGGRGGQEIAYLEHHPSPLPTP